MTSLVKSAYLFLCLCTFTLTVNSKEILFLDPVVVDQSFSDLSENQHSPNLMLDSNGYLLTYHIDGVDGYNIKTIRLLSEPQFNTISEYFIFDSTQSPIFPTVKLIDSKKAFFWYDRFTTEENSDTLFQQQLMLITGDSPAEEDFENKHSFYSFNKANSYQPQFVKTDNRMYSEFLKKELNDPNNNRCEFFLRSLDFESADIYPPNLHFSANGKTAMTPYGDSLLLVKSWIYCTDYENYSCSKWATGYKAYIIYENKIKFIHALSSQDISQKELLPDDIFVRTVNGENLFVLRQSKQLMKINYETMKFEELIDLTQYANGSYKKIIPLETIDFCILIFIDENHLGTVMRFDREFQFIDSVSIPFEGTVSEISDFVYDRSKDMLSYAYTTNLFENDPTSRIFLQSLLFDKELILNPPAELPNIFTLAQNYPNPFNPTTTINYRIPQNGRLVIDIFNMLGQKVLTLFDDNQTAGEHYIDWNASKQSSGMYLVKVSYDNQVQTIKTMLLK